LVAIDESGRCNLVTRRRNEANERKGKKYETGFHGDLSHMWFRNQFLGRAAKARTYQHFLERNQLMEKFLDEDSEGSR
jgi:hypothetical protein